MPEARARRTVDGCGRSPARGRARPSSSSSSHGRSVLVALVFALLALVAVAAFVTVESETRGFVALLFLLALTALTFTVKDGARTASLLVWTVGASAVPLLFAVHLFLRLSREERGARRVRPQGVFAVVVVAALGFAFFERTPSTSPEGALVEGAVGDVLKDALAPAVIVVAAALLVAFVVGLLATRRTV